MTIAEESPAGAGIFERLGRAQKIDTSPQIQHISDDNHGGTVTVKYDHTANQVLLDFGPTSDERVAHAVAEALPERLQEQVRKSSIGGDIIVHIPAQAYVDHLGGTIPGLTRSRGQG